MCADAEFAYILYPQTKDIVKIKLKESNFITEGTVVEQAKCSSLPTHYPVLIKDTLYVKSESEPQVLAAFNKATLAPIRVEEFKQRNFVQEDYENIGKS